MRRLTSWFTCSLLALTAGAVAAPAQAATATANGGVNGSLNTDNPPTDAPFTYAGSLVYTLNVIPPSMGRQYTFGSNSATVLVVKGSGYIDGPFRAGYFIDIYTSGGTYSMNFASGFVPYGAVVPLADPDITFPFSPSSPAFISSGLRLKYVVETTGDVVTNHVDSALF